MAQRPSFGALKKAKPTSEVVPSVEAPAAPAPEPKVARIQTSVRLDPAMWQAANDLATRKRVESGQRVTVHDFLVEGLRHVLEVNGIKLSR